MTIVTVMVTLTVYTRCQLVVHQRMDACHGTQNPARRHWQRPTVAVVSVNDRL